MLTEEEIAFIHNYQKEDVVKLILQQNQFPNLDVKKLANQIKARKKAQIKLPTFYANEQTYFPPTLAWQQCSSEFTAKYKAALVSGEKVADLTGGFGIDIFYLAKRFKKAVYIEQQKDLCEIVAHNNKVFDQNNIQVINNNSINVLKELKGFDLIYLDPARRDENAKKVITLEDSFPNIVELQDVLLEKANTVMLKTSPMLDIHQALRQLKNVSAIHVIAVENECKELIFLLNQKEKDKEIKLVSVNIHRKGQVDVFNSIYNNPIEIDFSKPKKYIYDPNKAIHKANVFNEVAKHFQLDKLAINTHLYTSDYLINHFQGRIFELEAIVKPSKKVLRKVLTDGKANLIVRNFPDSVANLKKRLKIQDGGNQYLIAVTLDNGEKVLLQCKRL